MVNFGSTLKMLRKKAGMTQKQLADKLWLSKATVSYYEQSLRYPSPEILIKLANVFHVTTDYLLGMEHKKQVIDVTDLTDEDIAFLEHAVELLRKKNFGQSIEQEKLKKESKEIYELDL